MLPFWTIKIGSIEKVGETNKWLFMIVDWLFEGSEREKGTGSKEQGEGNRESILCTLYMDLTTLDS